MRSILASLLLATLLAGCADQSKRPDPAPTPRVGVVGLVQEQRDRGITASNWSQAIIGTIMNDDKNYNANVSRRAWEVTVFYDDGRQDMVVVDNDPGLKPGQRVRVTGNKIEPIGR